MGNEETNARLAALQEFVFASAANATMAPGATRFARLANKLHQVTDQQISSVASELACTPGCNYCCSRLVTASAPEVHLITDTVLKWEPLRREALRAKLARYAATTKPFWEHGSAGISAECPFLEDQLCSIYECRPNVCRGINSRNAEQCREFYIEEGPIPPDSDPDILRTAVALDQALLAGLSSKGATAELFEMPGAVNALLEASSDAIPAKYAIRSGLSLRGATYSSEALRSASAPTFLEAQNLRSHGRFAEAFLLLEGQSDPASLLQRLTPPQIYFSNDEIDEWWSRIDEALTNLEQARLDSRTAWEALVHYDPFFIAYAGRDVKPIMSRLMGLVSDVWARDAFPLLTDPIEGRRRSGRVRVGYVGSRLTMFNGSRWALGWLRGHGSEIETYAFNPYFREDEVSAVWRRNADHYFHLTQPTAEAAEFIRSQDLDFLIFTDIGMSGSTLQLSSLRLARCQLTSWGHPTTSGSPMIDGYLSSELMEPDNGDNHYSERLIRLPNAGLTYPRFTPVPSSKSAADFGLPEHGFYLVPQLSSKILPDDDVLFREVGERGGKPIVFLGMPEPHATRALEERLRNSQVPFLILPRQSVADYARLLQLADVVLDPVSWNGGNTTIEALAMGTPVVSMSGEFMRGRHGKAFLEMAGVKALNADSTERYVDLAVNFNELEAIMRHLDAGSIYEDKAPSEALNNFILEGVDE